MKKSVLLCLALWVCTHLAYGQKDLKKVKLPNRGKATFERLDIPPPPPPPSPQLPPPPPPDSTELVRGLVKGFCDNLAENIKSGNVTLAYLSQKGGIGSLIKGDNIDALKFLSGNQNVDDDNMSFAVIEKGFRIAVRASLDNCPLVDTFFNYDGRQRPAYAHFNQAICQCVQEKKSSFKDIELAYLKYGYIRDSCFREVFTDPEQLKIAYAANDFQTKAEVDAFDKNFQGYFFKNCSEPFEGLVYGYKTMFAEMEKRHKAAMQYTDKRNGFAEQQDVSIKHIMHLITPTLGLTSERNTVDLFKSATIYRGAVATINATKVRFKNYQVVDYVPNVTERSDGITEYRMTMYQYQPKTKKRYIVCQLIFEFEGNSDLIAAFRYIDRSQIANLETLQKQLDERN
jgi:hypothetical protein